MAVLLVVPRSSGGIAQHVRMLASGLAGRGHRVGVAAPPLTVQHLAVGDVAAVHPLPLGTRAHALPAARSLRRLAGGYDVVHAHGVRVSAQAAAARVPVLVSSWHNAPIGSWPRRAMHGLLERVAARGSAVVLGASADLVDRARAAGARSAQLCEVAAPLVATPGPASPVGREPGDRRPVVLAIARLRPQKRLDLLVRATAGWADRPDRPRVIVAGDGSLRDALAAQAERERSPLELVGASSDVAALLAAADVLALPSEWEARPLAVQEALAAGVPVVATDVGGVRALVGDAAVLVPPGDAQALRAALEQVLADRQLRARLRAAGPQQAATWPAPAEMVAQIEQAYRDALGS